MLSVYILYVVTIFHLTSAKTSRTNNQCPLEGHRAPPSSKMLVVLKELLTCPLLSLFSCILCCSALAAGVTAHSLGISALIVYYGCHENLKSALDLDAKWKNTSAFFSHATLCKGMG